MGASPCTNSAPISTGMPAAVSSAVSIRPPTRAEASSTSACLPARVSSRAANSPAPPAVLGARSLSADGRVSTTEAGRCDLVSWDLNTLRLKTAAKAPAILVLSEGWYPGWRATVDGKDAPLYRAQVTLRGVAVPAGEHEVVFRFQPRSLRVGGLITGASLLALAAGVVFIRKSAFGEEPTAGGRRAAS